METIFGVQTRAGYEAAWLDTKAGGFLLPYTGTYGARLSDAYHARCFAEMLPNVRVFESRKRGGGLCYAVFAEIVRFQLPSLPNSTRRAAFYGEKLTLEEAKAVAKSVVDSISNGSK